MFIAGPWPNLRRIVITNLWSTGSKKMNEIKLEFMSNSKYSNTGPWVPFAKP